MFQTKLKDLLKENGETLFSDYVVVFNKDTQEAFCEDIDILAYVDYGKVTSDISEIKDWFELYVKGINIFTDTEFNGISRIEVILSLIHI